MIQSHTCFRRLLQGAAAVMLAAALAVTGTGTRAAQPTIQPTRVVPSPVNRSIPGQSSPIRLAPPVSEVVTSAADSGSGSLRDAIATANGDTANDYVITFNLSYPTTITLTTGALTVTGNVDIQGPGASNLTVSGNSASQVFTITAGTSTISGLTISDGKGSGNAGGAIQVELGATLDLQECTVQNSSGAYGGGVFCNGGVLSASACTFSGNSAAYYGGGVYISFSGGHLLSGCTFVGNTCSVHGGSLGIQDVTSATVVNCTFQGNVAPAASPYGSLDLALVYAATDMHVSVTNCTITQGYYGGPAGKGVSVDIQSGNTHHLAANLHNTIVWASQSDFVKNGGGTFVDDGYNFDSDGTSGFVDGANGDIVGTAGSPLNPMIQALAGNGGPVQTMALQPGSPCMDAGDPTFSNSAPTVDARGATRSGPDADGNGDGTSAPDTGAYEYQRYVVVNTNDSGAGSLRDAILHSNTYGGEVAFAIPPVGTGYTIGPFTSLPSISMPTYIDGWSQGGPGYKGPPLVRVDGGSIPSYAAGPGLVIEASNTSVNGLSVTGFHGDPGYSYGDGIDISGSIENIWIYGCYVGVDLDGVTADGNQRNGIMIDFGVSNVLIGTNADGTNDQAERNVVAANGSANIDIETSGTTVAGNYLGVGSDGTTALGGGQGISAYSGDTIGGTSAGAGNLISGNLGHAVAIGGPGNVVQGNRIGTTADGLSALGNGGSGIILGGNRARNNHIGGSSPAARNVICDNSLDGVEFYGGASSNTLEGNYIGVGSDGATPMGNHMDGVYVYGSYNVISGNVLSANDDAGIHLTENTTTNNDITGNMIGVDATGLIDAGNTGPGVQLDSGAKRNRIGTAPGATSSADRNVVACNDRQGGSLSGHNANVLLENSGTDYDTISGNYIGLDKTGAATFSPNGGPRGILLYDGPSNTTIGGTTAYARNVISGNQHTGVELVGSGTNGNVIEGNYLGTDSTGTKAIGNNFGIQTYYTGNAGTRIGGNIAGEGNLISGNRINGINLVDNTTQGTLVEGNLIGTAADGITPLGNTDNGLAFYGASGCTVGGSDAGDANVVSDNGGAGIAIFYGTGDTFEGNRITANGGLGIDLGANGVTPNDAGDADTGPNNTQNYPVLTVTATAIHGTLNSLPNENYRIEFFASGSPDPSGYGEGATFIGAIPVTTDASGNASFSYPYTPNSHEPAITATATNLSTGDTSEFSAACGVVSLGPSALQAATASLPYNQQLTASMAVSGGSGFTFALAPGSQMPAGLSLSPSGLISGTPTVVGDFTFTVVATEIAAGQDACTGSRTFSLSIVCPTILVDPLTLPSGVKGQSYTVDLKPSAGVPPFSFEMTSGKLPQGLTLSPDGTISGTYADTGTSTFTIKVTDKNGCTGQQTYTVGVFSLAFFDDGGASSVCLDSTTGAFQWTVLSGPNAGKVYTGTLAVYNGGTMFWSKAGASQYVYVYYDPNGHTAWAYLYDYNTGLYTSIYDSNTLNNPAGCGALPAT